LSTERHLENSLYYEKGFLKWKEGRNRVEGKPAGMLRYDVDTTMVSEYKGPEEPETPRYGDEH
jgi:hypothetical protein